MAIKLKIQDPTVRLRAGEGGSLRLSAFAGVPVYPDTYSGSTRVTPSEETQVLGTSGLMVPDNVVVDPIPSNYGRILYDGSTIKVY